ncbi:MAG: glycosyl transferase family 2 [Candidatus Handelsmanbacteria bacterium RIFCSPLOWO2_12_FULL_64_10]|uniref:Glycosyl transferase family 2 n=1 Tax=Handelsmanbacteria sp. (strain RIFCSPLOWO2_12_FULL_64_10) TaxID=1817868 RepID=A0A1F6CAC4_HANXR|nr:MAG: glycosyl transferase family 2 [Candidatus Handelsmanbacteria bacterium RIFCSPLOWO2_12_FULL_64_10]
MTWWQSLLLIPYCLALGLLLLYGSHRYLIVRLYYRNRHGVPKPHSPPDPWPSVTVQLPVYNERYVVERLIRSVAGLDYPGDRLEIQVLDDSTDDTADIAQACIEALRRDGHAVSHVRRGGREGFKAGALAEGLKTAGGEFIAVFDADFVPPPDLLRRVIPHFGDPSVGMVQTRWGHLNRDYSLLTKVQALFLDGHFVMEHGARSRSGLFFNFNGTAGVWRRSCIQDAGGWQHDTLTEDLDLSYRAQLCGWRFVFLPDVVAPAELPVDVNAYKTQQHRWVKGSVQTARKLLPGVLRSGLPFRVKAESVFHLTGNLSYLLMALVSVLIFPAILARAHMGWYKVLLVDIPLFSMATFAVSSFYVCSQREINPAWRSQIKYLPCLMSIGLGISLNNARAVLEALWGHPSGFLRTPKYRIERPGDTWRGKRYRPGRTCMSLIELALSVYFAGLVGFCLRSGTYFPIPFLMMFGFGFLYVGAMSIWQGERGEARGA